MIQRLGISNPTVSFSGIYATATKVDPNGKRTTNFKISLLEDNDTLSITNAYPDDYYKENAPMTYYVLDGKGNATKIEEGEAKDSNTQKLKACVVQGFNLNRGEAKVRLLINGESVGQGGTYFEDVQIDAVDGNSDLYISAVDRGSSDNGFSINKMSDSSNLHLDHGIYGGCKVKIGKIEGEKVKIDLQGDTTAVIGTELKKGETQTVNVWTKEFGYDHVRKSSTGEPLTISSSANKDIRCLPKDFLPMCNVAGLANQIEISSEAEGAYHNKNTTLFN
jgi:hypothetical protein